MNHQQTPDLDKIKALLTKVNALAERGIDGEKDAARRKLKVLLEKYGIALKEIQTKRKTKRTFNLKNTTDCANLFFHIVMDVEPKANLLISTSSRKMYAWLTAEQYIEVSEKYRYYWKLYEEQKKLFLHAFLIKNKIGLSPDGNCSNTMSEKEVNELMKLVNALNKGNFMPENRLIETSKN